MHKTDEIAAPIISNLRINKQTINKFKIKTNILIFKIDFVSPDAISIYS